MDSLVEIEAHVSQIKAQITATEQQLSNLKTQLQDACIRAAAARELDLAYKGGMPHDWQRETLSVLERVQSSNPADMSDTSGSTPAPTPSSSATTSWPLLPDEYRRYGRQLIMSEVGLEGQLRLKASRVLIVGVGGLGCPAATYLAGAGVGTLGLIDGDTVESSNLHRQIAHATSRVGQTKVSSAIHFLRDLNPHVNYIAHETHLLPSSALSVFQKYDLVLDCTDHPTSRYLISDTCVLAGKPLISASALKTEGQLIVLNNPPGPPGDQSGGPCYRCVFPVPPPPETLTSCSEGGILGPVVGTMGVLQSLEALKILTTPTPATASPAMLHLFSPYSTSAPFRSARMRPRRPACAACGARPTVTSESLSSGSTDYIAFCGATTLRKLPDAQRIAAMQLGATPATPGSRTVLDVRPAVEHNICRLEGSVNVPFMELGRMLERAQHAVGEGEGGSRPAWLDAPNLVVVCKQGNDSQAAVRAIRDSGLTAGDVVDVRGGFRAWRETVDPTWPDY